MLRKILFVVLTCFTNLMLADSVIDGGGNKLTLTETGSLIIPSTSKLTLKKLNSCGVKW